MPRQRWGENTLPSLLALLFLPTPSCLSLHFTRVCHFSWNRRPESLTARTGELLWAFGASAFLNCPRRPGLAADKSTFLGKEELDPVTNFLIITITIKTNTYRILFMSPVLGQSILHGTSHFLYPPVHEVQLSHFKVICCWSQTWYIAMIQIQVPLLVELILLITLLQFLLF